MVSDSRQLALAALVTSCDGVCLREDCDVSLACEYATSRQRLHLRRHLLSECPSTPCTSDTAGALLKRRVSSFSSLKPFIRLSKLVVIAARQQQSRRPAVQSGCDVT